MSKFSPSSRDNPLAGITLLVFSLFLFSLQDVVIKFFSDQYSVLQIVFIRGVIAGALLYMVACLYKTRHELLPYRPLLAVLRGLCGFVSYTTYYLAVASLPLAEVVAIVFTAPLFVTVMSALFLREEVGPRRWCAVVVGFIGVLIMLGAPVEVGVVSLSGDDLARSGFDRLGVVLSLIAAICYACQSILTRYLSVNDTPLSLAFSTTTTFTIASGLLSIIFAVGIIDQTSTHPSLAFLVRDWAMPESIGLALMIFLGFNGAIAFFCMAKSYSVAPASTITPFEYTYMIWAVMFGFFLWGEVPRFTTLIGVAILITSSLYIWQRERKLALASESIAHNQQPIHQPTC
jgi:S-adenosylmethionine uptake transporter